MDEQEEQELSLEDILKEFSQEQAEEEAEAAEDTAQEEVIRTDLPPREKKSDAMGDTIRLEGLPREAEEEAPEAPPQASEQPPKAEPYSEE